MGKSGLQLSILSFGSWVTFHKQIDDSISDELMARYYLQLLSRELPKGEHPLEAKKQLAAEVVATYHSLEAANKAREEWTTRFSEKRLSETDLPVLSAQSGEVVTIVVSAFAICGITKSRAEASRLIKQGSIQLDGAKLRNPTEQITLSANQILRLDKTHAVRVG